MKQYYLEQLKGRRKNQKEMKTFLETNENENTTYINPWDTSKTIPWGKFYRNKCLYPKKGGRFKKKQTKDATQGTGKARTKPKIEKEINEIETKKLQKINETRVGVFKKWTNFS